jgi:hypothetical protein
MGGVVMELIEGIEITAIQVAESLGLEIGCFTQLCQRPGR